MSFLCFLGLRDNIVSIEVALPLTQSAQLLSIMEDHSQRVLCIDHRHSPLEIGFKSPRSMGKGEGTFSNL